MIRDVVLANMGLKEWDRKRAEIETDDAEALYTIGVLCWDKVYHGGLTLDLDRRRELIEMGLDYLNRASGLRENYFEAISYVNLLYREKAKVARVTLSASEVIRRGLPPSAGTV